MPLLVACLTLLLLAPLPAPAVTVFDDGGVHVIDGPIEAAEVLNGTTVLTVPGAEVVLESLGNGITSVDSAVGVFGGKIANLPCTHVGKNFPGSGARVGPPCDTMNQAIHARGGAVTISAGELEGRGPGVFAEDVVNLTVSGGLIEGFVGLVATGKTVALVSGGTVMAQDVLEEELLGSAAAARLGGASHSVIAGGSFFGGALVDDSMEVGPSLVAEDAAHVEIRGGMFDGPWVIRGPDVVVEVYGRNLTTPAICSSHGGCRLFGVVGELGNGSLLSVELILEDGAEPPIIHELPEPSAALLRLAALGTLVAIRRAQTTTMAG